MANTITPYNPIFYAQEALIHLEKALGLAGRIHRGYDAEHRSFNKGDTINIRKPGTFTATDAPSAAQALAPSTVSITLNKWKEVKFELTDKELTFTTEQIIADHIRPAAVAIADQVDQDLCALAFECPWNYDLAGTTAITDLTGPYKLMFENKVPMADQTMLHYMVDSALQYGLQNLAAFNTASGAGDAAAAEMQMRGSLGRKFGFEIFANQNVPSKVLHALVDTAGAVNATTAAGLTTLVIKSLGADTDGVVVGDTFVIAGNSQRYAVTAAASVSTNVMTVTFTPPLAAQATVDAVVTLESDTHVANLAFHRNFAALATAPLSELGNQLGAKIASITDPITGLALRSRMFYDGTNSKVIIALDMLYGFKTLDPNLAVRCRG